MRKKTLITLKTVFLIIIAAIFISKDIQAQELDLAHFDRAGPHVGAGGIYSKYKQVSGPNGFGGDFLMWGARAFSGSISDPKLGLTACTGVLNGNYQRLTMKMGGMTVENGFNPDPYFKWRVGFGGGSYEFYSTLNKRTISNGSFAYVEPMLVGVRPISRHIAIEVGIGYTFAGAFGGIKIEGPCIDVNLLFGRFQPAYSKPAPQFRPIKELFGGKPTDSF
ncbi:MAG: hypothetical protein HQM10_15010 [Candidatus Riflebacteria bacterium]|nr:hypothetical protein [Candidatus Riflebacteria bacterium]